jgi:acyl-CoA synthetase (AMP-forming)/AMP-acid ligase II
LTSFPRRRDFNTAPAPEATVKAPIDFLYRGLARDPRAIAVEWPGGQCTFADLVAEVESVAAAFQEIDPTPGSRVGTCAWNTPEHLTALLATYAAGKVWVPLNPRNGRTELGGMVAATKPSIVVVDDSCLEKIDAADATVVIGRKGAGDRGLGVGISNEKPGPRPPSPEPRFSISSLARRYAGRKPKPVERLPTDEQIIKFSGGSTGRPKAVIQSVRCLNAQASAILRAFEFDPGDVNLVAAPVTHGTSCFILPILAAGGKHVLMEKANPRAILVAFQENGVTTVYLPPTLIYMLLAEPSLSARGYPRLRHMIYSAAPMPPERIRQVRAAFGSVLETAYGQVEAPQIITAMRAGDFGDERNLASVGRPVPPLEVAVASRDGTALAAGEVGEVVVRGDLVMNGYLDQPELTAETLVDGWLHTGDLGLLDERGYLYLKGRVREVINSGGFNIFPADVESVLSRHPAVLECSVFGMDDPKWGEAVHAAVSLNGTARVTESDLIGFVKRELDSVKAPKRVHFVEALPHNAVGKVSRREVREMVLQREKE